MNAVEFLREAEAKGIELELKPPDKIRYRVHAPVPDELIEELRRMKPELIKILQARQNLELNPALVEKIGKWRCRRCFSFIDEEFLCEIQTPNCIHLVSIVSLRDCPRRNKAIRKAILRGDHLNWLI